MTCDRLRRVLCPLAILVMAAASLTTAAAAQARSAPRRHHVVGRHTSTHLRTRHRRFHKHNPTRTPAHPGTGTGTAPSPTPTAPTVPTPTPTPPTAPTPTASTVPFTATGPWRAALPADAPLDPDSAAIVANINSQISSNWGHVALNTDSYSAPIYTVPADEPTVDVAFNDCQDKGWLDPAFAAALQNVPIPADAVPAQGSDAEMVIYQPSSDTEWEFWDAADNDGTWSACWGGDIQDVSQNPGIFAGDLGATASGLPLLGFLIRVQDLAGGSINHAINLELPDIRANAYSWPATRTDGSSSDPTTPAEGERFRFPASLDLSQFNLSPGELMIARAIQQYGMIVTDTSGSVSIQGEDPQPYETGGAADPYAQYFNGWNWLGDLPMQDLQAVAWNYGEPGS